MQSAELEQLVDRLWEARARGDHAPAWLNGVLTLADAQAVQLGLLARKRAAGEALGGWKVGLTSERARRALGADERPFGHVLASRIHRSGARIAAAGISRLAVEPELCFTVGERIRGAGVTRADIARGIASVAAGFELNERRPGSARPDFPAVVTDCLNQWGIVEGGSVRPRDLGDLGGVRCTLLRDGEKVYEGVSRDELDDHVESLRRLVVGLAAYDLGLEPGQKVITGAFTRCDAASGQHWRASYDGIGEVEVSLA